jgi:hypothetical protein
VEIVYLRPDRELIELYSSRGSREIQNDVHGLMLEMSSRSMSGCITLTLSGKRRHQDPPSQCQRVPIQTSLL